jgi:hypothetical protein
MLPAVLAGYVLHLCMNRALLVADMRLLLLDFSLRVALPALLQVCAGARVPRPRSRSPKRGGKWRTRKKASEFKNWHVNKKRSICVRNDYAPLAAKFLLAHLKLVPKKLHVKPEVSYNLEAFTDSLAVESLCTGS